MYNFKHMKGVNEVHVYALYTLEITPMPQCLEVPKLNSRYLGTEQAGKG